MNTLVLRDIRIPAALLSLLLSAWCIYIDPVINNDGFLYITLADVVRDGSINDAFAVYRWPFYSFMIAGLGNITGIDHETSAYLINTLLAVIVVVSFISITAELGGDRRVLWVAALVILFFPGLNKYRSFVIRDFGYLAFYMLGLLVFFKHIVKPQWYWPPIWTVLLATAAAFRIEAIAVMVCLPFISAYVSAKTGKQRMRIVLSLVAVIAVLFMLGAWWFAGNASGTDSFAGLLNTFIGQIKQGYDIRLQDMRQLLTSMSDNYALLALIAAGSIIFLAEIVKRITLLYTLMAVYGWVRGFLFVPERAQRAWLGLIIVQLIILSGTMLLQFFLTGRFTLALSLTVLLIVPFVWVNMYDEWRRRNSSRWLFPTALVFAIILGIQGLAGFTGKTHLKEGGLWLQQQLKGEQTLLSNERAVMYYAKQDTFRRIDIYEWQTIDRMLSNKKWQQYDYIALRFKRRHADHKQQVMQRIGSAPVKTFQGKRGDVLLVFRIRQS